jgi:hypothetical protein
MHVYEIVQSARTLSRAPASKSMTRMRLISESRGRPRAIRDGMLLPLVELIAWPGAGRWPASPWLVQSIALAVTVPFTVWLLHATRRQPVTSSADRPPNQFGPPPRSPE